MLISQISQQDKATDNCRGQVNPMYYVPEFAKCVEGMAQDWRYHLVPGIVENFLWIQ
jgi:hypothetical protein